MKKRRSTTVVSQRGVVLLMVLGILALLSVLAVSFVSMARLERSISQNYVSKVRVMMIAESGVEKAIAELSSVIGTPDQADLECMEFGPGESVGVSLKDVVTPSFAIDVDGDGLTDSVSGVVGSTYRANGDYFKLRVEEESAKFNLNDSPGVVLPPRMFRVIEKLTANLFEGDPRLPLLATDVAVALESARAASGGRFGSMSEVRDALIMPLSSSVLTVDDWNLLRPNLTLYSWTDPNTLKPNPPFDRPLGEPGIAESVKDITSILGPGEFGYRFSDPGTMHDKYDDDIYTVDQFQMRELELEPRSPVHVNRASRELIAALLEGIQGYYIFDYGYLYDTGDKFQLNTQLRGDWEGVTDIHGDWYWEWYMWGFRFPWPALSYSHQRNYRPLVFGNEQFDASTYVTSTGVKEVCATRVPITLTGGLIPIQASVPDTAFTSLGQLAGGGLGVLKLTTPVSHDLAADLAQKIYDRIHVGPMDMDFDGSSTHPLEQQNLFRTWPEFKKFIYAYFDYDCVEAAVPTAAGSHPFVSDFERKAIADAILANLNPNSDLIDFNPNKTIHKRVDKGHLVNNLDPLSPAQGYSTEFCLEPTGVFSIECFAELQGATGESIASSEVHTCVELWTPYRMTSQAQFYGKDGLDRIGASSDFSKFFVPNAEKVPCAGAGAGILGTGDANGFTAEIYPEACVFDPATGALDAGRLLDAAFDGYIMPATTQPMDAGSDQYTFRASFNASLDADYAKYLAGIYSEDPAIDPVPAALVPEQASSDRLLISTAAQKATMQAQGAVAPVLRSGTHYKDGAYSEAHRAAVFHSGPSRATGYRTNGMSIPLPGSNNAGNFGSEFGQKGRMFFWVKPNWMPEQTGRPHTFMDMTHTSLASESFRWMMSPIQTYWMYERPNTPAGPQAAMNWQSLNLADFSVTMHPARNREPMPEDEAYVFVHWSGALYSINPWISHEMAPFQAVTFRMEANMGNYALDQIDNGTGGQPYASYKYMRNRNYIYTETVNHRHKTVDGSGNVDGHRWNFIGIQWNMHHSDRQSLRVNEVVVDNELVHYMGGGRRAANSLLSTQPFPQTVYDDLAIDDTKWRCNMWANQTAMRDPYRHCTVQHEDGLLGAGELYYQDIEQDMYRPVIISGALNVDANPMRFGAWARGKNNFVADSTFDEIQIFANASGDLNDAFMQNSYAVGRYYNGVEPAVYKSPSIDPRSVLKYAGLRTVSLRSVSWTCWWPDDTLDGVAAADVSPGPALPEWEGDVNRQMTDPITVDVALNGVWLYAADNDDSAPATSINDPSGSKVVDAVGKPVHAHAGDQVKFKIYFNVDSTAHAGQPLHEAPVLDDVTLMFEYLAPKVLVWSFQ